MTRTTQTLLIGAALLIGSLFVDAACAQTTAENFQAALNATGTEYFRARDTFLETPDRDFLIGKLDSENADEWVLATILLGWLDNESGYRQLIQAETRTSRTLEKHYPWASRQLLDRNAAPLLVELLIKGGTHENAKFDAAEALTKMLRSGVQLNPKLFTVPLEHQDATTRQLLASIISALPPESDDKLFETLNGMLDKEQDPMTARYLLNGMVHQSSGLSAEKKSALVENLNAENSIQRFGQQPVYSALAEIGGEEAEAILLKYFDDSIAAEDESERRDAVTMLFKISSPAATERLLMQGQTEEAPEHLRKLIHSGLANLPYDPAIESHLLGVLKNDGLSAGERIEAVKSLEKIRNELKTDDKETSEIQGSLKMMLEGGVNDPALEKSLQDSVDRGLQNDKYQMPDRIRK